MPTIRELLESNFNLHEQAFDGLMGKLPDWVPEQVKTHFYDCRRKLQTQYPDSQIVEWMNQCDELTEISKNGLNDAISFDYPPPEVEDETKSLARVRYAVSLEETEGLRELAGEQAVKGKKFSSAGSSKKGREYEPKKSIRRVVQKLGKRNSDEVLMFLEDAENCELIYQDGGVMFDGVDKEKKILFYYDSNSDPDKRQELKFKRLGVILSEIK